MLSVFDSASAALLSGGGRRVGNGEKKEVVRDLRSVGRGTEAEVANKAHELAASFTKKPDAAAFQEARRLVGIHLDKITNQGEVDLGRLDEIQADLRPFVSALAELAGAKALEAVKTDVSHAEIGSALQHASTVLANGIPDGLTRLTKDGAASVIDGLHGTERQAVDALADRAFKGTSSVSAADLDRAARKLAAELVLEDMGTPGFNTKELAKLPAGLQALARLGVMIAGNVIEPAKPKAVGAAPDTSFSKLAAETVPARLETVRQGIDQLGAGTMPHDVELKSFRKALLSLRTMIDAFAHSYPVVDRHADPLTQIRDHVDQGYEAIGSFKDEFDSQGLVLSVQDPQGNWSAGVRPEEIKYPNAPRLELERQKVLEWKESFGARIDEYADYLGKPSAEPVQPEGKRNLSELFWGGVKKRPKPELSGLQNISRLTAGMIGEVEQKLDKLLDSPALGRDKEKTFHETRKQLRSALSLTVELPGIVREGDRNAVLTRDLEALVTQMGTIADKMAARDLAPKKDRAPIEREIQRAWKDLRKEMKKQDLEGQLAAFVRNLVV